MPILKISPSMRLVLMIKRLALLLLSICRSLLLMLRRLKLSLQRRGGVMSFLANNWDGIMTILNAIGLLLVAKKKGQ